MRFIVFFTIFVISNANASVQVLMKEFLSTNMGIVSNKMEVEKLPYNVQLVEAQNDWFLNLLASYTDEEQVGFFSFNSNSTRTYLYSLALTKRTMWGGTVELTQEVYAFDLREWASPPTIGTDPYQVSSTFSYTQDLGANFFGAGYRTDVRMAETQNELSNIQLSNDNQNLLLNFFTTYLNTKLDKTLVKLNQEALSRASKRRRVIAKRVRDGLSKKVDLYQAKISELTQKEALRRTERSYYQNQNNIAGQVHRSIRDVEISGYNLEVLPLGIKLEGGIDTNMDLRAMERMVELAKLQYKKSKLGYVPVITLKGSYSTNSIEQNLNEAMSESTFAGHNQSGAISLNVNIPLGYDQAEAETTQSRIELKKSELSFQKMKLDLLNSVYNLERRIEILKEEITFSKEKRGLAKKALKETNRLYLLGRKDFEDLIRSEETLIQTEVNLVSNVTFYNNLLAQYASLKGKLLKFVYQFRE
jgi:outer membrane protein TolC